MDSKYKNIKILIAYGEEELALEELLSVMSCRDAVKKALLDKGFRVEILPVEKKDLGEVDLLKEKILASSADVIFNLFEGVGEDSFSEVTFARILEELKIPFTGNPSRALKECLDKNKVKDALAGVKIKTPSGFLLNHLQDLSKKSKSLKFPLIIKPAFQDASCGINRFSYITSEEELYESAKIKLAKFPRGIIIEEFIQGCEYAVGLVGNNPYEVLAISVIDFNKFPEFLPLLTYESKWDKNAPEYKKIIPLLDPPMKKELRDEILDIVFQIGKLFSCRGYFRVDLREDERGLFVLDVNPNPDISKDAGFARMAEVRGYSYSDIIEKIVNYALDFNYVENCR